MFELAKTVAEIKRACNPDEPLEPEDPRYVDLSALHVGETFAQLYTELGDSCDSEFLKRCVSGHHGSGKSTQLLKLVDWANNNGFLATRVEVTRWFGSVPPLFPELFLLACLATAEAMQVANMPLPEKMVSEVTSWFNEITQEDKDETRADLKLEGTAQGEVGVPLLSKLIVKFTAALQGSSSHAQTVRERLRSYPNVLLERTNALLDFANQTLRDQGRPCGLLLVFDNLDRYDPEKMEEALFRSSDLVQKLKCHSVFTVPIGLAYAPGGPLQDCYGTILVQPMVSLRDFGSWQADVAQQDFISERVGAFREVLAKRIDTAHLFWNPEDIDRLVWFSGGCLRDLMHLVGQAAALREPGSSRLSGNAVQKALQQLRANYARPLEAADWALLGQLARGEQVSDGERKRMLLHRRPALLYQDNYGAEWYNVHPLLVPTKEFQDAYHRRSE